MRQEFHELLQLHHRNSLASLFLLFQEYAPGACNLALEGSSLAFIEGD